MIEYPRTFIFLGSSGSGKGTQARNIRRFLEENHGNRDIIELGMGDNFREFWKGETDTHELSRNILYKGGLQPAFLQIYIWSQFLIDTVDADSHLLIDGTPRRIEDSHAISSAFSFYGRREPCVIYLKVSREWAKKRLVERALAGKESGTFSLRELEDSDEEKINNRLDWFEEFALPAIDFFREKEDYRFIEINGEQTIEEVRDDIFAQAFT